MDRDEDDDLDVFSNEPRVVSFMFVMSVSAFVFSVFVNIGVVYALVEGFRNVCGSGGDGLVDSDAIRAFVCLDFVIWLATSVFLTYAIVVTGKHMEHARAFYSLMPLFACVCVALFVTNGVLLAKADPTCKMVEGFGFFFGLELLLAAFRAMMACVVTCIELKFVVD